MNKADLKELVAWKKAKQILIEQDGLTENLFRKYNPIWVERGWLTKLPHSTKFGFANVVKIEEFLRGGNT